jgi:hypothetical protein
VNLLMPSVSTSSLVLIMTRSPIFGYHVWPPRVLSPLALSAGGQGARGANHSKGHAEVGDAGTEGQADSMAGCRSEGPQRLPEARHVLGPQITGDREVANGNGAESLLTRGHPARDLTAETAHWSTITQIYEGTNQIQRNGDGAAATQVGTLGL